MKKLYYLLFCLQGLLLMGQNPADVEHTFGAYPGIFGGVNKICLQPDGKILVGGPIITFNGQPQNYLIRLNPDETKDDSFNIGSGFDNGVNAICLQPDGKILVGGYFTTFNGQPQNNMIRLNPDGTKDLSFDIGFNIGTNVIKDISKICLQPDGKILVLEGPDSYFGVITPCNLIRLNPDGTKDNSFDIGFNNFVSTICLQPDGKILAGGYFTTFNGQAQKYLIRLNSDGSKDSSFDIGTGFDNGTGVVCVQPDGKILVGGGSFNTYKGQQVEGNLLRLNSDGTKDISFNVAWGLIRPVSAICLQPDGKILEGGEGPSTIWESQYGLIRLNPDGTKDNSFDIGSGFNSYVNTICLQPDGRILTGGYFTTFQGNSQNGLIRFNVDGTQDDSFKINTGLYSGFDSPVNKISKQSDGKILISGGFTSYQGQSQNRLIRLNLDGTKDISFDIGTGFDNNVSAICLQPDGKILVCGAFTTYQGQPQNGLIRLNSDGTPDNSFNTNIGIGTDDSVHTICLQPDGKILVGRQLAIYTSVYENSLIRLNPDGTQDNSFNTGTAFDIVAYAICLQPDGKILAGGYLPQNGNFQLGMVRLNPDGTKDDTFNFNFDTGHVYNVNSICLQPDSKILVGSYTSSSGQPQNSLIRLNADGTKDNSFNIGIGFNSDVDTIYLQPDGKILAGGYFTTFNGQPQNYLIRLNSDGTKDNSFDIGTGFNRLSHVSTICSQSDGKILIGGLFSEYQTTNMSSCLIRLNGDSKLSNNKFETEKKIIFYPNPVKDNIIIASPNNSKIESLEVYDLLGKLVLQSVNPAKTLNVSHFNTGVYLLKIYKDGQWETHKFMKE